MFENVTSQPVEMPQPIKRIRFLDVRLNMTIEANLFDWYNEAGHEFLVIQPVAQELGKGENARWMPIDLDDTAFPVSADEMRDIVEVE